MDVELWYLPELCPFGNYLVFSWHAFADTVFQMTVYAWLMYDMQTIHTQGMLTIHTQGMLTIHTQGMQTIHIQGMQTIHIQGMQTIHTQGMLTIHTQGMLTIHTQGMLTIHTPGMQTIHTQDMQTIHTQGIPMFWEHVWHASSLFLEIWNFEKSLCFIMGYSLPWKHVTLLRSMRIFANRILLVHLKCVPFEFNGG